MTTPNINWHTAMVHLTFADSRFDLPISIFVMPNLKFADSLFHLPVSIFVMPDLDLFDNGLSFE